MLALPLLHLLMALASSSSPTLQRLSRPQPTQHKTNQVGQSLRGECRAKLLYFPLSRFVPFLSPLSIHLCACRGPTDSDTCHGPSKLTPLLKQHRAKIIISRKGGHGTMIVPFINLVSHTKQGIKEKGFGEKGKKKPSVNTPAPLAVLLITPHLPPLFTWLWLPKSLWSRWSSPFCISCQKIIGLGARILFLCSPFWQIN